VDATTGAVAPFAPAVPATLTQTDPWVYALLADGSKLYAEGTFNRVDGKSRQRLAAFDNVPTGGELDPAWRPSVNGNIGFWYLLQLIE